MDPYTGFDHLQLKAVAMIGFTFGSPNRVE